MLPIRREAFSWILLLLSLAASIEQSQSNEARVVCYYTNWSIYRPGTAKFSPQNINPYLCTHLIYAFGGFTKDNQLKPFDKYQDIEKGGYAKFNGLKTYNKNLKTILAIGGWNEGSSRFSAMVASPDRRREFVKNAVKFLRQNHFDGLDLDWEYPAFRDGGKPRDKENYAKFVQELREEFNRESEKTGRSRLLLTMAVPAGTEYIQKGYDIPKLNKYLDWFNLLTYDYHSAFEPSTAHHSPLFALEKASEYNFDSELNIDYTIKFYINEGADPSKLVLGIPTYGRSYTLLNEESTDMGAPTDGPGAQGDATREKGYLAYYEICQSIKEDDAWTVVQPNPSAMGPYAFRENLWVGYDDEAIARAKGEYVVANGLGGIMFWSIDNDDFRGTCHGRPYPIIEAAKEALNRESGSENDVITPAKRKKPSRSRSRINSNSKTNNVNSDQDEEKTIQRRPTARRTKPTPKPVVKEAVEYSSPNSKKRTTTPEPPTTPNPGADFKCEEEGFFPNPQDCKKYFWCLDSGPSNLGIVAHHFTCPSGLIFNKLTDSCDYARNVICEKPKTTTQSATTESTTKKSSTAKSIIIGRPSTTTPAQSEEEEEEEYDEEEDEPVDVKTSVNTKLEHALEEEDPEVIKELITLIKKVGGLDELEKQLQMRLNLNENSAIVGTGGKTTTTTVSPISQSQSYNKVLGTKRGNLRSQKVFGSTQSNGDVEPLVQRQNKENRYSSVIRNSRPRPQNDGLDKLPEVEGGGLMRERPQYTTITRTQAPKSQQESEDEENENNNRFSVTQSSNGEAFEEDDNGPTTHQPVYNYVNIQRARPSSTAAPVEDEESGNESDDEADDEDEDEEVMSVSVNPTTTSKMHYVNIQRIRPTKQHYISDEIESETPVPETKYKAVSRKRPTTTQISIIEQDDEKLGANRYSSPTTTASSTTVESVNNHFTNTPETSTRFYGSLNRRTTTIQTEQYSTTPQTSSSSYDNPNPSTTTTPPQTTTYKLTTNINTNDNTNTHDSQYTTQLNDLGIELTVSTLQPNAVDNSNVYTTTDDGSLVQLSDLIPQKSFDTTNSQDKKTDNILLTPQTNQPDLINTKYSQSSKNSDSNSRVTTEQDEHLLGSKLTTTILPTENPSSPTVTPSSFVFEQHQNEYTTTQSNQIESSSSLSMFKPTYGGGISSPRPFSFSKRTRPTTTTTTSTTTELPSPNVEHASQTNDSNKVSVASNQNDDNDSNYVIGENLLTHELNGIQVSGADANANAALNVTLYSIAKATDDNDEHTNVVTTNDITTQSDFDNLSSNTSQASSSSSTSTVSSIVNSSTASANSRFRYKTRVNTQQTTEQSILATRRTVVNRRIRTRPTARHLNAEQNPTNPILDDDSVRHVTYNIARQNVQQTHTEIETNDENEYKPEYDDRTNVIRQNPALRRFRPKLSDLLQETSNGLPAIAHNPDQGDRVYRPDQLGSDFSSLTSIDLNRKQSSSQQTYRSRNSRRRTTKPTPEVIPDDERPEEIIEQEVQSVTPRTARTRVVNRFSSLRGRTRVSSKEDSVVEQSNNVPFVDTVADVTESDAQPTVVPLARKINLDTSFKNRLNAVEKRKKQFGQKSVADGGDSPIIFLHPRRYSTKTPPIDFNALNMDLNAKFIPNANVDLNEKVDGKLNVNLTPQNNELPVTTESLNTLIGNNEDQTSHILEAIEESTSEEEQYGTSRLFRQKVEEIQGIIDSFKSTEISLATETTTTSPRVGFENGENLLKFANAIGALNDDVSTKVPLAVEATTVDEENLETTTNGVNAANSLDIELTVNSLGSSTENIQFSTEENRSSTEEAINESTSLPTVSRNTVSQRRRPAYRRTTEAPVEISSSTENERRRLQSRRRFTSTTTEENSVPNDGVASSTARTRQQVYRGRVRGSANTISRYSKRKEIENEENVVFSTAVPLAAFPTTETSGFSSESPNNLANAINNLDIELTSEIGSTESTRLESDEASVELLPSEKSNESSSLANVEIVTEAGEIKFNLNINSAEITESSVEQTIFNLPSEDLLPPVSENSSDEIPISSTETVQSTESSSTTEVNQSQRNVVIRRRPANRQRVIESNSAVIQTISESGNEHSDNVDVIRNDERRRKIFRGRVRAQTAINAENTETEHKNTNFEPRRRRIQGRPTSTEATVDENVSHSENEQSEQNAGIQITRQRRPLAGRRFKSTTTEASELNENDEHVELNQQEGQEKHGNTLTSRQRVQFSRTRFSTTTTEASNLEENIQSENVEENQQENQEKQENTFKSRQRVRFSRRRFTTTEASNLNDNESENVENASEEIHQTDTTRQRLPFARRRFSTSTAGPEANIEQENVEDGVSHEVNSIRQSTNVSEENDGQVNVQRNRFDAQRRPNYQRARSTTESTVGNDENANESVNGNEGDVENQSQNIRVRFPIVRKRPYGQRAQTSTQSAEVITENDGETIEGNLNNDNENAEENVNTKNENQRQRTRISFPVIRRRPFSQRGRTSTENVEGVNESTNFEENVRDENENAEEAFNTDKENRSNRVRITDYRRRQFASRTRVESGKNVEESENHNENAEENTNNDSENTRARIPALRRRPFPSRTKLTTETANENGEEAQTNEENSDSSEQTSALNSFSQTKSSGFRRPFGRTRLTTTEQSSENHELKQEQEQEQVNEEINDELTPRSRPTYKRKKITSFKAINVEESLARTASGGKIRFGTKPVETVEDTPAEEKEIESTKVQVNVSERQKANRKLYARTTTTTTTTTPAPEDVAIEENVTEFNQDTNEFGVTEAGEEGVTQVDFEAHDIESGTLSDLIASTEVYTEYLNEFGRALSTESSNEENSTDNQQGKSNLEEEYELSIKTVSESKGKSEVDSKSEVNSEKSESNSEINVESNAQADAKPTVQRTDASNAALKNLNIQRRRKKLRKIPSSTAAPEEVPETASVETTPERKSFIGARSRERVKAFVPPGLRSSRKQLIQRKEEVKNSLDSKEETEESVDQIDGEVERRPRPIYSPKLIRGRTSARPKFSLKSTTENLEDEQDSSVTRRTFTRKYTKVFKLPKSPNDDDTNQFQDNVENDENQSEETDSQENQNEENDDAQPQLKFRPKGYSGNSLSKNTVNNNNNDGNIHPASLRPFVKRPTQSPEPTVVLDGINVNALNVRNRNLFNKNSKKHGEILKTTHDHHHHQIQSSQLNTNTDLDDQHTFTDSPISELELPHTENPSYDQQQLTIVTERDDNDNFVDSNTNTLTDNNNNNNIEATTTIYTSINAINEKDDEFSSSTDHDDDDDINNIPTEHNMNSINLVDNLQESATIKPIRKYSKSTTVTPTTIKPTTYHHVFAIDYDENPLESKRNQTPNEIGHDDPNASVISKKVEKLAEVNRIVEVYSQQRRQTIQRSSNGKQKSQTSNLIIERLPTVNKLGEINRVTLIKLVDHQNDTKPTAKEFITFLTTTARPAIDDDDTETVKKEKKSRQIFLPDSIFSVETSTIPLEGLFQTDRNGKRLNIVYATTADDSNLQSSPSSVFIPQTTTDTPFAQTTVVANGANDEFGDTTADSVNDIHVVNVKQSNAIPNDSATPLVISLSNLDSVQLLSPLSSTKQNATTKLTKANAYDGAVASSGKVSQIIDAPHVVVEHSTVDNIVELSGSPVVNTHTSYSSEITQTKVKLSQLKPSNAPSSDTDDKSEVRPQYRPGFRRPTITVSKKSKPTQSNDITDTTESSFSVTTRKSLNNNNPYVRRRSRPTYIPTTSHTTVAAIASTVANRNNDTIVNKILQRRKFGRPSSAPVSVDAAGTVTNTASERKRVTQTKTRPTTESAATVENLRRTQNPYFRRRYAYTSTTKSPKTTTIEPETISVSGIGTARHSSDQEHEPSIVDRKFSQSNQIDLGTEIISQGLGEAITSISRAPLPFVASTTVRNVKITTPGAIKYNNDDSDYQISKRADSPPNRSIKPLERQHLSSTVGPDLLLPHSEIHDSQARPSRDFKRTEKVIRTFSRINLNSDPSAKVSASLKDKPKKIAYRPVNEYDYYDDGDSIIGKSTSKVKVILHDAGIIECLDQGNFPHPLSCRKFISCAKMEIGGVVGWEYTCPKGLSYDPVGGICNWAAGLGCKE
ncbi:uncharacterized protein LOC116344420 [Contarinia nasturtii]|uniref:uncharacterized protein LOC116344420 n=1 Tax=Contarinia nasturtii TaxID=265458 RepID=UPI0012D40AC7|nr:uncharacterized protein LOC116344420 [Contarinia nasturtii]